MKKIGFKNFRRFKELDPIELGAITFLVGPNNSGKSTVVKALVLLENYLNARDLKTFPFDGNILDDVNIVTFDRALSKDAEEDMITFNCSVYGFDFEVHVIGNKGKSKAEVIFLKIKPEKGSLTFEFRPKAGLLNISNLGLDRYNFISEIADEHENKNRSLPDLKILSREIEKLEEELLGSDLKKSSKEYLNKQGDLNKLKDRRNRIVHNQMNDDDNVAEDKDPDEIHERTRYAEENDIIGTGSAFLTGSNIEVDYSKHMMGACSISDALDIFIRQCDEKAKEVLDNKNKDKYSREEIENYQQYKLDRNIILADISDLSVRIGMSELIYLGSNPTKQSGLFGIRDNNNALAQAIHNYYQSGIEQLGEGPAFEFIRKWMGPEYFAIGDDLEIITHAGEAYEVNILDGKKKIPLADKGMGTIQLMLILLRVASEIDRIKDKNDYAQYESYTFILEEPEQNLHPALQHKLADFFFDINKEFGIKFIIETHSEYIIKRSQVITLRDKLYGKNPFKVYYFDVDGPYEMKYTEDGKFDRSFGRGFTNVATGSTKEIIKLLRK